MSEMPFAEKDFVPGELDALMAEGESSIRYEGTVDADEVLAILRRRSEQRQAKQRLVSESHPDR